MKAFDFTLKFALAKDTTDASCYIELLGEAGCDDALVAIGQFFLFREKIPFTQRCHKA